MSDAKQQTFETAIEHLQGTVKKLESGDLSLEDSLAAFEEGVKLSRFCQEQLTVADQRVELLMKTPAGEPAELQPFPGTASQKS